MKNHHMLRILIQLIYSEIHVSIKHGDMVAVLLRLYVDMVYVKYLIFLFVMVYGCFMVMVAVFLCGYNGYPLDI